MPKNTTETKKTIQMLIQQQTPIFKILTILTKFKIRISQLITKFLIKQ